MSDERYSAPKFATTVGETLARADALHSELLGQIQNLAESIFAEREKGDSKPVSEQSLRRITFIVEAYEASRFSFDDNGECHHVSVRTGLKGEISCVRCGLLMSDGSEEPRPAEEQRGYLLSTPLREAAPEMLALLHRARPWVQSLVDVSGPGDAGPNLIRDIDAVIAKATEDAS